MSISWRKYIPASPWSVSTTQGHGLSGRCQINVTQLDPLGNVIARASIDGNEYSSRDDALKDARKHGFLILNNKKEITS